MHSGRGKNVHRSRHRIIYEILKVARDPSCKSRIVYRTNLNFKIFDQYFKLLEPQGLLKKEADRYITTSKGRSFIATFRDLELISRL